MRKILLLLPFMAAFSVCAQDDPVFDWARTSGGIAFDIGYGVISDAEGNVYTVGVFNGTVDMDPGSGISNLTSEGTLADAFVQKLDSHGNFVWAKKIGGSLENHLSYVKLAQNGDLIIGGSFNGTVDFDPNPGNSSITSIPLANPIYSSSDVCILRLSQDGNLVWAKRIGGAGHEEILDLQLDSDGNIYASGYFASTCDFDPGAASSAITATGTRDGYVVKLDPDGNYVWAGRIGGVSESRISRIGIDNSGNVYGTGNYFQAIDVDPGSGQVMLQPNPPDNFGQYSQDCFLFKWNQNGEFEWANRISGNMSESSYGLAVSEDAVYVSGWFSGSIDMDPGEGETLLSVASGAGIFLGKYDSAGAFEWARQTGSVLQPDVCGIKIMPDGDLAMFGEFQGSFPFAPGIDLPAHGNIDVFIARFDSDGNPKWAQSFGGSDQDYASDFSLTDDGIWHITGGFASTANLDPFEQEIATSAGWTDVFTLRLAPEQLKSEGFSSQDGWSLYPNPSAGQVFLSFDEIMVGAKIRVYSVLGQKVSERNIIGTQEKLNLRPGNYVVKVESETSSSAKKVIIF